VSVDVDCGIFVAITHKSCFICEEHMGEQTRIAGTLVHEPLQRLYHISSPVGVGLAFAAGGKCIGVGYATPATQSNREGVLQLL
jgi:hypothetical protein